MSHVAPAVDRAFERAIIRADVDILIGVALTARGARRSTTRTPTSDQEVTEQPTGGHLRGIG